MLDRVVSHVASLSESKTMLFGLVLALAIEAFTAWARFGLGLQSTRDTGFVGTLTFGIRVHHGYIGVVLLLIGWLLLPAGAWRNGLLMVGVGLIASDLMHHFLVLWPVTGSPQFDLVYPHRQ